MNLCVDWQGMCLVILVLLYIYDKWIYTHCYWLLNKCVSLNFVFYRLQYFAQGCQVYIKQLRLSLQGKIGPALQEEENKIKIVALRTTTNINAVIKVLTNMNVWIL